MIISPKVIIEKNILTSPKKPFSNDQFQPNGIDVRINTVRLISGFFSIEESLLSKDKKILPKYEGIVSSNGFFHLKRGIPYSIDCLEDVNIPKNVAAIVYGRSSLNRNGIFVRSSLYDSGFKNTVGITMYPWIDCYVGYETRIAQIIFFEADSEELYNGSYQGKE